MKRRTGFIGMVAAVVTCIGVVLFSPDFAAAHCDTMDGPVVTAANIALEKGDVTPVMKWVKKEYEAEIREAFKKVMAVRAHASETKKHAEESVEKGREFVEAYVEFLHYLERLHLAIQGRASHHGEAK